MKKRDPFPLSPNPRRLVNQSKARGPAPVHNLIKIVHGEADVMDSRSALVQETADRIVAGVGLEQFDKGIAGLKARDPGAVGIIERYLGHAEDVTVKIDTFVDGANRDSDVRNPGSAGAWWVH